MNEVQKTIYFVRHGQSRDNTAAVFQSPDSPLTDDGVEQAKKIAERASRLSFDALISSTFRRAKETAEVIAKTTGKEIEFSDMFVERVKPTSINGKPHDDERASALWDEWNESLYAHGIRVEDGENFDDLVARADRALEYLESRSESSIIIVTHGFFLRTIMARVLLGGLLTGEIFERFQKVVATENTGITVLQYGIGYDGDRIWRIKTSNDYAHLG